MGCSACKVRIQALCQSHMYIFFIQSSVNGHLNWFYMLAIVQYCNKHGKAGTSFTFCFHVLWIYNCLWKSQIIWLFSFEFQFEATTYCFPQLLYSFVVSLSLAKCTPLLNPFQHMLVFVFVIIVIFTGIRYLIVLCHTFP